MKYSDAPEKFLESEVDLDEQIKSLLQVGGAYPTLPYLVRHYGLLPGILGWGHCGLCSVPCTVMQCPGRAPLFDREHTIPDVKGRMPT
jgi:hypothetical protein